LTLSTGIDIIKNFEKVPVSKICNHVSPVKAKPSVFKDFANDLTENCMKLCLKCIMAGKMDSKDQCEDELHQADYKVMAGM
jgi:hypothetical protein